MKKILLIDSGVGAISVLNEIRKSNKNVDILVFVDNKNAPFGDKDKDFLCDVTYKNIITFLNKYDIGLIVLACNTLTVGCIDFLRAKIGVPIVGTEPNVKVNEPALALCTPFTAKWCKVLKGNKNITILPMDGLSTLIDKNLNNLDITITYLKDKLNGLSGFKNIILGCTHYSFIKKQITSTLNGEVTWLENKFGVAKRVSTFLDDSFCGAGKVDLILSKKDASFETSLKNFIN